MKFCSTHLGTLTPTYALSTYDHTHKLAPMYMYICTNTYSIIYNGNGNVSEISSLYICTINLLSHIEFIISRPCLLLLILLPQFGSNGF